MKHVIFGPLPKPAEPIQAHMCSEDSLYFMVYQGLVYHLHRSVLNSSTVKYTWASAQGMCLGGPFYAFTAAVQYASSVNGKVYQFDNWSEVVPDLLK